MDKLNGKISLRSDTKENWENAAPYKPLEGEVCVIKDGEDIKFKIGDGQNYVFNNGESELPWASAQSWAREDGDGKVYTTEEKDKLEKLCDFGKSITWDGQLTEQDPIMKIDDDNYYRLTYIPNQPDKTFTEEELQNIEVETSDGSFGKADSVNGEGQWFIMMFKDPVPQTNMLLYAFTDNATLQMNSDIEPVTLLKKGFYIVNGKMEGILFGLTPYISKVNYEPARRISANILPDNLFQIPTITKIFEWDEASTIVLNHWDGAIDGLETFTYNGKNYYKTQSETLTDTQLDNIHIFDHNNRLNTIDIDHTSGQSIGIDGATLFGDPDKGIAFIMVTSDGITIGDNTSISTGVYNLKADSEPIYINSSSVTIPTDENSLMKNADGEIEFYKLDFSFDLDKNGYYWTYPNSFSEISNLDGENQLFFTYNYEYQGKYDYDTNSIIYQKLMRKKFVYDKTANQSSCNYNNSDDSIRLSYVKDPTKLSEYDNPFYTGSDYIACPSEGVWAKKDLSFTIIENTSTITNFEYYSIPCENWPETSNFLVRIPMTNEELITIVSANTNNLVMGSPGNSDYYTTYHQQEYYSNSNYPIVIQSISLRGEAIVLSSNESLKDWNNKEIVLAPTGLYKQYYINNYYYGIQIGKISQKISSDFIEVASTLEYSESAPISSNAVYQRCLHWNNMHNFTGDVYNENDSQKLARCGNVKDYVDSHKFAVDNEVYQWSDNPVSGKAVYNFAPKITVDTEVTADSSNAVSSKAVYEAIQSAFYVNSEELV